MSLPTYTFAADAATGAPAGAYVAAETAASLEQTLSKLCWTVLYGKAYDASSLAVGAEQLLERLRKAQVAA